MFLPTEFSLGPIGTSRENNKEESFHNGVHIEWTIVLVQRSHGNAQEGCCLSVVRGIPMFCSHLFKGVGLGIVVFVIDSPSYL